MRLVAQSNLSLNPCSDFTAFIDTFGNRRLRVTAGSGPLRLHWQSTVEDDGQPDVLMAKAKTCFGHLPEDRSRAL